MRPFEELDGNPIWDEYCRQEDQDPDRINLTDLWRASKRKRGWSPRQYARMFCSRSGEIDFQGKRPDDPAIADHGVAFHYVQLLDDEILEAHGRAFSIAIRQNPAGMLLSDSEYGEEVGGIAAMFISAANAVDGSRTEGDARILEAAVEKTNHLDTYAQETLIAKAQRALRGAKTIRSGRLIDGEFVQDI